MSFFNRFKLELEDFNEELIGLPLEITNCRVVDIGCGMGYKTLGLMPKLQASECIGIDKFIGDWSSPALDEVQQKFDSVKEFVLKEHNKLRDDSLKRELWELFRRGRHPIFQKGDIVKGEKLPSNLDLVYCKKVLGNIFTG